MKNGVKIKVVVFLFGGIIFVTGCGADPSEPTRPSEQEFPTETVTSEPSPTELPSATPSPSNTPTPDATATPIPTETPTSTPLPTETPTATPHPFADILGRIVLSSYADSSNAEIVLMNPDGSEMERLTDDGFFDFAPQFSPDGETIVFSSDRDGTLQIYIMNIDGSNIARLAESEGNDRDPSWSPDGSQITFASDQDGDPEIFVINADGSGLHQLTNNDTTDVAPVWSPDGEWIAFSSSENVDDPNIYVIRPDGSEKTRITNSPSYDGDLVSWSQDGKWLIFPSQRIGNYELYAYRLEDGLFGAITRTEGDEYSGSLSADGRYLLINAFYEDYIGIIIQDLATGETSRLTEDSDASNAAWQWDNTAEFDASWLEAAFIPDETCIYSEDESYGYTAENPIPIGNGPFFGEPFAGFNLYTYVRIDPDEAQSWYRGHTFPSNSNDDILDTLVITTESGVSKELYVSINDYSNPDIPVGMYCDLEYP